VSKLTDQLQKTIAAGAKADKAVNLQDFTRAWGVDHKLTVDCLDDLVAQGIVEFDNAPDDLSALTAIQVHRIVIHGTAVTQLRLEESPAVNNREESGREEITDREGQTIRATVAEERVGEAWTGFYLLNVAVMDGTDVAEELQTDLRFDAKDVAWAYWDSLKVQYSPFADKPEPPAFERRTSYILHGREYQVAIDNLDGYSVAKIYQGDPVTPVGCFEADDEGGAWGYVEKWYDSHVQNADLVKWLDGLEPIWTYVFDGENDPQEFGDFDGCNAFNVDKETLALMFKAFNVGQCDIDEPMIRVIFDGSYYEIGDGGARYPGLDGQPVTNPDPQLHALPSGASVRVIEMMDDEAVSDYIAAKGWERYDMQIESMDDVETQLALESLLKTYDGAVEVYSFYDPVVSTTQSAYAIATGPLPEPEKPKKGRKPKA
jgi:hypothetical protein